ncbi:MAG: helix-turn-helix domain-containing protein [Anaerotignum sp.]|nr:helix-turn-helix domain-containing protein [Anaerotignum sp.]
MEQKQEAIKVYTLQEIEPILGVSYRTLLQYVNSGRLKGVKIGKNWKISEENLKKFINGEG